MVEISNHQKSLNPQSHAILANHLGVPPHTPHRFHVHLHNNPYIVIQHPHDSPTQTFPCGKCMKLLSDYAIFLPHLKTFMPHHLEDPTHSHPKNSSTISLLTVLAVTFTLVNLVLL